MLNDCNKQCSKHKTHYSENSKAIFCEWVGGKHVHHFVDCRDHLYCRHIFLSKVTPWCFFTGLRCLIGEKHHYPLHTKCPATVPVCSSPCLFDFLPLRCGCFFAFEVQIQIARRPDRQLLWCVHMLTAGCLFELCAAQKLVCRYWVFMVT